MAEKARRTVRKGRIYPFRVDTVEYRAFIWEQNSGFCGRVEDQPQVEPCRGRTAAAVLTQLSAALSAERAR